MQSSNGHAGTLHDPVEAEITESDRLAAGDRIRHIFGDIHLFAQNGIVSVIPQRMTGSIGKGTDKRRGLFFGVLSRCYFRVALSVDETLSDPYELSKFVIENPLRFRELTWRSFSSERMIVLGALKAEKRVLTEYPLAEENTKHFAEIAKLLSKLGSVMLLDCMTEKDIEEYVYKKYRAMVEEELANRGLLKKLKDAVAAAFHG